MNILNTKDYGKLIRNTRKQQKLTQAQLAAATGLGVRFVQELEKGKPSCQLGKALWVASMLGIKLEVTLPETESHE
jgi:y4mF family transcriptional regulator